MKFRRPTFLSVLMTAVVLVAAAALVSTTFAPHNLAFADKGGNGKGNNGNGKGNGGGNGSNGKGGGNGNGGDKGSSGESGNSGKGNSGNSSGKGKDKDKDSGDDNPSEDGGSKASDDASPSGGAMPNERASGGRDRVVRSEIVVADASAGLSDFAASKGFRVLGSEALAALDLHVTRLQAPAGLSSIQARNLIAQAFPDAIVDFNHLYQPQASLELPAPNYAARAVHWSASLQECGGTARLGLIDTAVDWSLPILRGARGQTADFLEDGAAAAPRQHGTGIATLLVGQEGFGLMPGAELYSAGIFGIDEGGVPIASATSFASALNWLLTQRVATINVSLSGPPDRLMELAVKSAQRRGAVLVAAVGNDGTQDVPRFPAAYSGVIGVTAVDQSGKIFSDANRGDFVALAAPGVNLLIPGQASEGNAADRLVTGTSFAAPYVTATLASYGNDSARMLASAHDLGAPGIDPVFGRGLVQAPNVCLSAASAD